jgi:[ribosomal protein S5]-alanine N-acetyltransferase
MRVPTFTTERLLLRDFTDEDAESYQKHFAQYKVLRHLSSGVPWPYPADGAQDYISNYIKANQGKDMWFWGITLKTNPEEIIGSISLWRKCTPENRGFWLGTDFWGKGLMTEAVGPVNNYAFDTLNFEKLILSNALGNQLSRRIKEKNGARFLRTEPAKFVDPSYTEREVWELTRAEWVKHLHK